MSEYVTRLIGELKNLSKSRNWFLKGRDKFLAGDAAWHLEQQDSYVTHLEQIIKDAKQQLGLYQVKAKEDADEFDKLAKEYNELLETAKQTNRISEESLRASEVIIAERDEIAGNAKLLLAQTQKLIHEKKALEVSLEKLERELVEANEKIIVLQAKELELGEKLVMAAGEARNHHSLANDVKANFSRFRQRITEVLQDS